MYVGALKSLRARPLSLDILLKCQKFTTIDLQKAHWDFYHGETAWHRVQESFRSTVEESITSNNGGMAIGTRKVFRKGDLVVSDNAAVINCCLVLVGHLVSDRGASWSMGCTQGAATFLNRAPNRDGNVYAGCDNTEVDALLLKCFNFFINIIAFRRWCLSRLRVF